MSAIDNLLKTVQPKATTPVAASSSGKAPVTPRGPAKSAIDALLESKPTPVLNSKGADVSGHVFNPLNTNAQRNLDQITKGTDTSVKGNLLKTDTVIGAVKDVGKIAGGFIKDLAVGAYDQFAHPSEEQKNLEEQGGINKLPTMLKKPAQGVLRFLGPMFQGYGDQLAQSIVAKETADNAANAPAQTIGKKAVPNSYTEQLNTHDLKPGDYIDALINSTNAGLAVGGERLIGKKSSLPYEEKTPFIKSTDPTIDVVPDRVVQTIGKDGAKTYYTIPKVESKTIIDKVDNSGGIVAKGTDGETFHVTAKTPAQMEALGFEHKGTITADAIPEPIKGTGEVKTRGLSQGVEAKAIENKLTTSLGELPEYQTVNMKEQARAASDLLAKDYEQAKRIAMGRELPPDGILPESLFVAVEDHAIKTGDVATLRELATNSGLTSEATTMGQRIRTLAERNPDSPVAAIQKVMKIREDAATRKFGNVKAAKLKVKTEIMKEVRKAAPKAKDWSSFLAEIKCK